MNIDFDILLNLPSLHVTHAEMTDREAHIYCESILTNGYCPVCMQATQRVTMYHERLIRDMPLLGRKVSIHLRTRQFHCNDCKRYFNESFSFVDPNKTITGRYEAYLYKSCAGVCISNVSIKEDITWSTIKEIYDRYAQNAFTDRDVWRSVRYLGIDEIAVRKGHKNYACCLVDTERGIILDFLEDRKKETICAYFREKGAAICAQIKVVNSDMWQAYSSLAGDLFPNAISVIDRYHFFVHINKALDATRKSVRLNFPDEESFKHLRWSLLKNPAHLTSEEDEILQKAFKLSENLKLVYTLRCKLKTLFDKDLSKEEAAQQLDEWQEKAKKVDTPAVKTFLKTLTNWKDNVLNFFHQRQTNAVVEGLNNAIRGIIRRSFGFHAFESLRIRIITELG